MEESPHESINGSELSSIETWNRENGGPEGTERTDFKIDQSASAEIMVLSW